MLKVSNRWYRIVLTIVNSSMRIENGDQNLVEGSKIKDSHIISNNQIGQ